MPGLLPHMKVKGYTLAWYFQRKSREGKKVQGNLQYEKS